jgi:hypothetical protein
MLEACAPRSASQFFVAKMIQIFELRLFVAGTICVNPGITCERGFKGLTILIGLLLTFETTHDSSYLFTKSLKHDSDCRVLQLIREKEADPSEL